MLAVASFSERLARQRCSVMDEVTPWIGLAGGGGLLAVKIAALNNSRKSGRAGVSAAAALSAAAATVATVAALIRTQAARIVMVFMRGGSGFWRAQLFAAKQVALDNFVDELADAKAGRSGVCEHLRDGW